MKTQIFLDTYKGHEVLGIWAIDEHGEKVGKAPIISFGLKKAKCLVKHATEIAEWVASTESEAPPKTNLNLDRLSHEEKEQFLKFLAQMS